MGRAMPSAESKVSTRGRETRQRLLDAGLSAFSRKSSQGVNLVEDVLRPAGISVGSFYFQFTDKNDLLVEIIARAIECRQSAVNEAFKPSINESSLQSSIHSAVGILFDSFDDIEHGWQMQLRESASDIAQVKQIILKGRRKWTSVIADFVMAHTDLDKAEAVNRAEQVVIYGTGVAKYYLELPGGTRGSRRTELINEASRFLTAGLGAPPVR